MSSVLLGGCCLFRCSLVGGIRNVSYLLVESFRPLPLLFTIRTLLLFVGSGAVSQLAAEDLSSLLPDLVIDATWGRTLPRGYRP